MNNKTGYVYAYLKKEILLGEFEDGEHLTEMSLAEKYEVNRVHVKSALEQLAAEQLVEYRKNRGFYVIGLTDECIKEINALRKALTKLVCESILPALTDEQLDEMDRIVERTYAFYDAGLTDDAIDETERFYRYFQSLSGYTRVVSILDMYNDYIFAIIKRSVRTNADYEKGTNYLRRFVSSLRSRDMDKVCDVIKDQDDYKADPL